jgi:hypothetical protein
MVQAAAMAEKVAVYRHTKLAAVRLAGELKRPTDGASLDELLERIKTELTNLARSSTWKWCASRRGRNGGRLDPGELKHPSTGSPTPVAQLPFFSGHSVFWSASPRAAFANSERSNRAINSGGAEPTASLYAGHIR